MITVSMICGPSGCGKSTFARELLRQHPDKIYIATDAIREELFNDENDQQHNHSVFETAFERIKMALSDKIDVIFDATNLSAKRRKSFVAMCRAAGADYCACYAFKGIPDVCIANQLKRSRQVPKSVVRRQCAVYEQPTEEEGWDMIIDMEAYNE